MVGELALRTESHFREVLSIPSQRLTSCALGANGDASIACFKEAVELRLWDWERYISSLATRRLKTAGEQFLLTGLLFTSLLERSLEAGRKVDRDRDREVMVEGIVIAGLRRWTKLAQGSICTSRYMSRPAALNVELAEEEENDKTVEFKAGWD